MSSGPGVPYLGSKISLISKSEIRYEGILYTIDTKESTVALAKVRSYGTEDRPTDRPVAPREETYEYIIFKGADIKEIKVCQAAKPMPCLEGGLPNDPAIVQYSDRPPGAPGSGAPGAPGSSKPPQAIGSGTSGYGPIGSGSYGSNNAHGGGAQFSSGPSNAPGGQSGSPVMELLRDGRSGGSSPAMQSGGDAKSPVGHDGQAGRGRGLGFYRGSRGRGGGGAGQGQNFRGGRGGGGRGGFKPGMPTTTKKEHLKFDSDYDFDKANDEFKEVLEKLQKTSISAKDKGESDEETEEVEDGEIETPVPSDSSEQEACYDKKKSFFDSISCEASEKSKGRSNRPDWKAEKKLNRETFGVAGNIRRGYRRGYGHRGGYNNRGGGGGGYNNYGGGRGGYNNHNQGGGGYNNRGDGGQGFNHNMNGRFARDGGNYNNFRGGRGQRGAWGGQGQRGQRVGGGGRGWGGEN